jgi:hypothetical protein
MYENKINLVFIRMFDSWLALQISFNARLVPFL